ncbi:MAG: RidA family protein [Cyanobacterium sp. T60_A2020_053]|nr:RidA family protein [Cyanobacterium sp. T60_A2020_053]
MTQKTIINTTLAPAPVGPYNQAVVAKGAMVFVAGQIPLNAEGNLVGGDDIKAQTHQVIKNIQAILTEAGTNLDAVVKTSVFLSDLTNFAPMNEVYGKYFSNNSPARACVEVSRLPKDVLVEIECIAVL